MEREQQKKVIEAILFLNEAPMPLTRLCAALEISPEEVKPVIEELKGDFASAKRGLHIFETAEGFQMGTLPELAPLVEKAFSEDVSSNLTTAALETLAIIAYKQPVTRIEIESIRGVRSEQVLINLIKRKLIRISGRKDSPGRPLLYTTTGDFLKYFGLKDLNELPDLEIEEPVNKPEETS